jgi:hypothetical protein
MYKICSYKINNNTYNMYNVKDFQDLLSNINLTVTINDIQVKSTFKYKQRIVKLFAQ